MLSALDMYKCANISLDMHIVNLNMQSIFIPCSSQTLGCVAETCHSHQHPGVKREEHKSYSFRHSKAMILPQVQVHKFTIQSFNFTDLWALQLMSTFVWDNSTHSDTVRVQVQKSIMRHEWSLRQPREGLTKCHFPTIPVLYPTSFRPSAIVVSFRGSPTALYTI